MNRSHIKAVLVGLLLAGAAFPAGAGAQSLSYGKASAGPDEGAFADAAATTGGDAPMASSSGGRRGRHGRAHISPYIEAMQVVSAQLAPTHDVLT